MSLAGFKQQVTTMMSSLLLAAALLGTAPSLSAGTHSGLLLAQADAPPLANTVVTREQLDHESSVLQKSRPSFAAPITLFSISAVMMVPGFYALASGLIGGREGPSVPAIAIGLGVLIPAAILVIVGVVKLVSNLRERKRIDVELADIKEQRERLPPPIPQCLSGVEERMIFARF